MRYASLVDVAEVDETTPRRVGGRSQNALRRLHDGGCYFASESGVAASLAPAAREAADASSSQWSSPTTTATRVRVQTPTVASWSSPPRSRPPSSPSLPDGRRSPSRRRFAPRRRSRLSARATESSSTTSTNRPNAPRRHDHHHQVVTPMEPPPGLALPRRRARHSSTRIDRSDRSRTSPRHHRDHISPFIIATRVDIRASPGRFKAKSAAQTRSLFRDPLSPPRSRSDILPIRDSTQAPALAHCVARASVGVRRSRIFSSRGRALERTDERTEVIHAKRRTGRDVESRHRVVVGVVVGVRSLRSAHRARSASSTALTMVVTSIHRARDDARAMQRRAGASGGGRRRRRRRRRLRRGRADGDGGGGRR